MVVILKLIAAFVVISAW